MKLRWNLLFIGCFLGITTFAQQDIDLQNLVYGRSDVNISKLWFVDQKKAIGVRRYSLSSERVKDIILIDKQGLVVDSLCIPEIYGRKDDYRHDNISHVLRVTVDTFVFIFGNCCYQVSVQNNRLIHQKITNPCANTLSLAPELQGENPYLLRQSIGQFKNILIGYKREKSRKGRSTGVSEDDIENFPQFWVAEITPNQQVSSFRIINEVEQIKTQNLFLDTSDWDLVWNRTNIFQPFYSYHDGKLFFNVVRSNKLYIYDIFTKEITSLSFPDVKKGESFFYYFDYSGQQNYLVKKSQKQYEVYGIDKNFKQATFLTTTLYFPREIVNGHIHYIKEQKENKKTFFCHYLAPISNAQQAFPITLQPVLIKPNK